MAKTRLDVMLVERGLAESRQRAQALIMAGKVRVNGQPSPKAGTGLKDDVTLTVLGKDHPWVGRGGLKLQGALDAFKVDPTGWTGLDIGASTGGFTDVLLSHGAKKVYAIDVGKNQLHWRLRSDPRVISMEGVNARHLQSVSLPELGDIAVMDVSFISVTLILPALIPHLKKGAPLLTLVKPQFEAGRGQVGKGGIVRDPDVRQQCLKKVKAAALSFGYGVHGEIESPIQGTHGNIEFLLHLTAPLGTNGSED